MTLTGILQLFAGPGAFCWGLIQFVTSEPHGILHFFAVLYVASITTDLLLNLVLALNRVKVILKISAAPYICNVLMALACLYGVFYTAALLSPYCGYVMTPGHYVGSYDISKPYSELFRKMNSTSSSLAFLCYLVIIVTLVWMRSNSQALHKKEWSILIYAGVRFTIDTSLTIVFLFVDLRDSPRTDIALGLTYMLNQLLVSPLLYFAFNGYESRPSTRRSFWREDQRRRLRCVARDGVNTCLFSSPLADQ
uniref:G protein-coupled receptor n=1 Tax=Steinernema glaseri TaxID=37863 RepID=A0A1I7YNU2_9BILA